MRLYLINPSNPLVSIVNIKESRWNRYRVWKPLSLMVLAGLTPPEWEISILDENLGVPDYPAMPRPDLVGITAFTSQANRAYEVAAHFRRLGVPVVMGGIHATMCLDEVLEHVDSVVTGEAEGIWPQVLEDARQGRLKRRYDGGFAEMADVAAGPSRSAVQGVCLWRHPDDARLPSELQLLQRDGVQRGPLPAAAHSGRRARVPVDSRETGSGGGRQPHRHSTRTHRPRQGPVPRHGPGEPAQGMDRPGHHQLRRRRGTPDAGREGRVQRRLHRL